MVWTDLAHPASSAHHQIPSTRMEASENSVQNSLGEAFSGPSGSSWDPYHQSSGVWTPLLGSDHRGVGSLLSVLG